MDMDAFKPAFRNSLARLPKEILETVPALVSKYLPILEKVMPAIVEDLKPHMLALMMEKSVGALDQDELMAAVKEVLESFGIKDAA